MPLLLQIYRLFRQKTNLNQMCHMHVWIFKLTVGVRGKCPQNKLLRGLLWCICTEFWLNFEKHMTCFRAY